MAKEPNGKFHQPVRLCQYCGVLWQLGHSCTIEGLKSYVLELETASKLMSDAMGKDVNEAVKQRTEEVAKMYTEYQAGNERLKAEVEKLTAELVASRRDRTKALHTQN